VQLLTFAAGPEEAVSVADGELVCELVVEPNIFAPHQGWISPNRAYIRRNH
jgi:hypothetical protein